MLKKQHPSWFHNHDFGQGQKRSGEIRTIIVILLTASMMMVEIYTGVIFGSIALLADGLHMASHTAALAVNAFAYIYARQQAYSTTFSFGTGKVNALGGFSGAILLAIFALMMAWESFDRLLNPVTIAFNQAIVVAILGLLINGVSVLILGDPHDQKTDPHDPGNNHFHDHNLRAAYLHVLADTLTSILAIFALLAGKYLGLFWMDPLMGIVGTILVARWSFGLVLSTSGVLLDKQGPEFFAQQIRKSLEIEEETQITDLHIWSIGPNIYCAIISLLAKSPQSPMHYKRKLPSDLGLVHITIEVNPFPLRRE